MVGSRNYQTVELVHDVPLAHEWVMVGGFNMLLDRQGSAAPQDCMIQPVAIELKGYGLEETLLKEMCAEVEHAGEMMRDDCPPGSLHYVNVRVHLSRDAMHCTAEGQPWGYFLTRQIASSESDSLDGINDPRGFIDLHVFLAA